MRTSPFAILTGPRNGERVDRALGPSPIRTLHDVDVDRASSDDLVEVFGEVGTSIRQ